MPTVDLGRLSFPPAANEECQTQELQPVFVLVLPTLIAVLGYSCDKPIF